MMSDMAAVRLIVHGSVQGVFFRDFTYRHAEGLGLTGYVRNIPDGSSVEVVAEGEKTKLEDLIDHLNAGPPHAIVEKIDADWLSPSGSYSRFYIRY